MGLIERNLTFFSEKNLITETEKMDIKVKLRSCFESFVLPFSWVNTEEIYKTKAKKLDGTTKRSMKKESFPYFFILLFCIVYQSGREKFLCVYTPKTHLCRPNWLQIEENCTNISKKVLSSLSLGVE